MSVEKKEQEEELVVEIIDDEKLVKEDQVEQEDRDEELSQYSESVKRRIAKLTKEKHDERRAREAKDREAEAAFEYANRVHKENEALKARYLEGEKVLVDTAKKASNTALESARAAHKKAFEAGDAEALAKAQEDIARAITEQTAIDGHRPSQFEKVEPPKRTPARDERSEKWQSDNSSWFMKDEVMTALAMGVHQKWKTATPSLVGSDEYYKAIDEEVKKRFPDKFKEDSKDSSISLDEKPGKKVGVVVASGANRTAPSQRTVKLTATQMKLCERLNITPQQYAAQLLKDQANV